MKTKKPNAELVWKQLEDQLAPRLRLSVIERTVYAHLVRHSRLEGKLRVQFSMMGVGRNIRLSAKPVRKAVRRLVAHDALRMVQRSKTGHIVEVCLPDEIPGAGLNRIARRAAPKEESTGARALVNLAGVDFIQNKPLPNSIHAPERSQCFSCSRHTPPAARTFDHV